ncbi:hypothetical protein [Okeania sp. SIO2B3]|uniref:hypothetical protein n=1 Tax=Okeania sp. SIO2B3 TaxID=2607784 RepID=UPI0013BF70DE|nr:hypothetical protein [Okeania sp. SIO2B3]NET44841.1 hypothetical protein [Okeania sp. SIO2B3]
MTDLIRLTWLAPSSTVRSQLLIRKAWTDFVGEAKFVYPDLSSPLVIVLPVSFEEKIPPVIEIKKYIPSWRFKRFGMITEDDYSVIVEAYTDL